MSVPNKGQALLMHRQPDAVVKNGNSWQDRKYCSEIPVY
jgi:hypothetical protein